MASVEVDWGEALVVIRNDQWVLGEQEGGHRERRPMVGQKAVGQQAGWKAAVQR